ncbi:MAG TPA: AAA family ATPase [Spirochaetota bacterium]|nr:AAA family ATPase [Spirochaetota bacterium]
MKTGLVIGKFLPPHKGHLALIDYGLANCDELIILIHITENDYIEGERRICFLNEIYKNNNRVRIEYTNLETLPSSSVSDRDISKIWAFYLSKLFPEVRIIFSSEKYGEYLAEYMNIECKIFDMDRIRYPISATMIRENPYIYWEFIPEQIKSYFVKKICIYGPESTGKSILTEKLANYYNTIFVPEVAREIIDNEKDITPDTISQIFISHADEIIDKSKSADRFLFVDSDYITTEIYSNFFFKTIPPYPQWVANANQFDLYLFCDIDVPWVYDKQRFTEKLRKETREWFMNELIKRKINYEIIDGSDYDERFNKAVSYIEKRWRTQN